MKTIALLIIFFFTLVSADAGSDVACTDSCSKICLENKNCLQNCNKSCEKFNFANPTEKPNTMNNILSTRSVAILHARHDCRNACFELGNCAEGTECRLECSRRCQEIHPLVTDEKKDKKQSNVLFFTREDGKEGKGYSSRSKQFKGVEGKDRSLSYVRGIKGVEGNNKPLSYFRGNKRSQGGEGNVLKRYSCKLNCFKENACHYGEEGNECRTFCSQKCKNGASPAQEKPSNVLFVVNSRHTCRKGCNEKKNCGSDENCRIACVEQCKKENPFNREEHGNVQYMYVTKPVGIEGKGTKRDYGSVQKHVGGTKFDGNEGGKSKDVLNVLRDRHTCRKECSKESLCDSSQKKRECKAECAKKCYMENPFEKPKGNVLSSNTLSNDMFSVFNARHTCRTVCYLKFLCEKSKDVAACRTACYEKCALIHPLKNIKPLEPETTTKPTRRVPRNVLSVLNVRYSCRRICYSNDQCEAKEKEKVIECRETCANKCKNETPLVDDHKNYPHREFKQSNVLGVLKERFDCRENCFQTNLCEKGVTGNKCRVDCAKGCKEQLPFEEKPNTVSDIKEVTACAKECVKTNSCSFFGKKGVECRSGCVKQCVQNVKEDQSEDLVSKHATVLENKAYQTLALNKGDVQAKATCSKLCVQMNCQTDKNASCYTSCAQKCQDAKGVSPREEVNKNAENEHLFEKLKEEKKREEEKSNAQSLKVSHFIENRNKCKNLCLHVNTCKTGGCEQSCDAQCKRIHPINTLFEELDNYEKTLSAKPEHFIEEAPEMNTL